MAVISRIDVRYPDADPMGIVNHAVYPVWMEIGRMDLFSALGTPYTRTNALGINPAMVSLNVRYHSPTRYPDIVTVETRVVDFAPKKLRLAYEVRDGGGKLTVSAETFHIWTGPDMKPLDLERTLPDFYGAIAAACAPKQAELEKPPCNI